QHADEDAVLGLDAAREQAGCEAVHPPGELAVGDGPAIVDEGELVVATGGEVALDEVEGRVVVARDAQLRGSAEVLGAGKFWHRFSLPVATACTTRFGSRQAPR